MDKYIHFTETLLGSLGVFDVGIKWSGTFKITMCIITLGTFYATAIFDLLNVLDDFSRFAENFSITLVGFTGLVKFFSLMYNKEKMRNLIGVVKWDKVSGEDFQNDMHRSIVGHYDQSGLRFCKTYGWIIYAVSQGFLWQTLPSIFLGHGLQLPFPAVYPFNLNSIEMFIIAFVHQIISVSIYFIIYLAFDTWFISLIYHACGNFCLLQNLLEKIHDADQQPQKIRERIVRCVRLHQNIYKFSAEIEDVFNIPNLMHFVVSSIAICTSGYEVAIMGFEEPHILVKHISSIFGQIVQLFIFNWCGQLMEEKSFGVSQAILRSNWYKLEIRYQRDLGLILLRAQKPAYMTAGKFSNLSLLNFSNLMKASMSYFTVLTSFQED